MVKKMFIIPPDKIDTTRHPGYPEGDNRSRDAFTWNLASKKGKIFQNVIKPAIIKMIGKTHSWILKSWDPEGYKYDDPRMNCLDENLHGFIREYYDHEERKLTFMHQAVDIALFILKEDIYYRGRVFHMLNGLPKFQLTAGEMVNIEHDWKAQGSMTYSERCMLENEAVSRPMEAKSVKA